MEKISFEKYQAQANELMSSEAKKDPLTNAALGLAGESGECADIIKKVNFQGHELDKNHLAEELGDVLWYLAEACYGLNISLADVAQMNLDKLNQRFHGTKFNKEDSIHRQK